MSAYQMSCNVKKFEQMKADEANFQGVFFVNPNTIITNNHVVTGLKSIIKVLITLDKKIVKFMWYSEKPYLAVIKKIYNFPSCKLSKLIIQKLMQLVQIPKDKNLI